MPLTPTSSDRPSALAPYRVLDLTGEIGHMCGRAFAEMGADVIKVEPPGGDPVRMAPPFIDDVPGIERSLLWSVMNLSKRGITLDLDTERGRALLLELIATSDLVVESYVPGELAALGIDRESIQREQPRLVWMSITGFGQHGPYASYRWSDLIGMALGGLLYIWGDEDRPPVRARAAQAYYQTAMASALTGMAALYHARRTGQGQYADVSMQEVVTLNLAGPGGMTGNWYFNHTNVGRSGPSFNLDNVKTRILYACKDGYVACAGYWGPIRLPRLIRAMKLDDAAGFLEDPKWLTASPNIPPAGMWRMSLEETEAIMDHVQQWLLRYTRVQIMQKAIEFSLVMFPVQTVAENLANEQLLARDYFRKVPHAGLGTPITYPSAPVALSETPWMIRGPAPLLGQHNAEVFAELGGDRGGIPAAGAARVV